MGKVRRMRTLCAGLAVLALALAGCGGDDDSESSSQSTSTQQSTSTAAGGDTANAAGKQVFTSNCGGCHTLADAGTNGQVGPVLDLENPFRYVEVRGTARVEPDADGAFAHKLHGKYDADVSAYDRPGEERYVVTIEPARIRPVDMSA
jgi:mono/diheme cytochrome c family protein